VLLLILRICVVVLLYAFLARVLSALIADLRSRSAFASDGAQESPGAMIVLEPAETGLEPGTELPLQRDSTIGRDPANAIVLDDDFVSAEHAKLSWIDGVWWLEDLGSTNGTLLEGRPVSGRVSVKPGNHVHIGRVRCKLAL
jgi:pSer/pThr/pTyr-binding forkhead associated (FHA) protein